MNIIFRYEQIIDQERIIADNEDFLRIALQVLFPTFSNPIYYFHQLMFLWE